MPDNLVELLADLFDEANLFETSEGDPAGIIAAINELRTSLSGTDLGKQIDTFGREYQQDE